MDMSYGLRPITEDQMRAIIPAHYWKAFRAMDTADQCFLIANPTHCDVVRTHPFKVAREHFAVGTIAKERREAGDTWAEVQLHLVGERGSSPCESTLRLWVAELP